MKFEILPYYISYSHNFPSFSKLTLTLCYVKKFSNHVLQTLSEMRVSTELYRRVFVPKTL